MTTKDTILTDLGDIKNEAMEYFKRFLQGNQQETDPVSEVYLDNLLDFRYSEQMARILVRPVTTEEIKEVVFSMPLSKAPGPDGYRVEFFRTAWPVVGSDFIKSVQSFFLYGFMPRGVNETIVFDFKNRYSSNHEGLSAYSLLQHSFDILYKVISKLLANQLKCVLPLMIELNQCAFVKDKLLLKMCYLLRSLLKNTIKIQFHLSMRLNFISPRLLIHGSGTFLHLHY